MGTPPETWDALPRGIFPDPSESKGAQSPRIREAGWLRFQAYQ